MTKLIDAMRTNDTTTANGMPTNSTSLNNCVDLFFHIGAMRGQAKDKIINAFVKAYHEDSLTAMKILFWSRDIRGGAGERQIFKDVLSYMANTYGSVLSKNIHLIPEFGRWDDLFVLLDTPLMDNTLSIIKKAYEAKDGLLAKWLPRVKSKSDTDKRYAKIIRKHLGLSIEDYRKNVASMSNTVENLMCSGKWNEINYAHIPSKAMSDYMSAFKKHDPEGFANYLTSLEKGETKINASAVYPYDIVKNCLHGQKNGADAQWKALPNWMENSTERLIPLVDTSGSMCCAAGKSSSVSCLEVAISLGIYISEKNLGPFKDAFITFSNRPTLQVLSGSLSERIMQLQRSHWEMNTNLEAVFRLILDNAVKHSVPESEMPTMVLILSDMQFDSCIRTPSNNAFQMIESQYVEAGYKLPKVIFWNLNSVGSDSPVSFRKDGVGLVSGFSPSILRSILAAKNLSPYDLMMETISNERYSQITI